MQKLAGIWAKNKITVTLLLFVHIVVSVALIQQIFYALQEPGVTENSPLLSFFDGKFAFNVSTGSPIPRQTEYQYPIPSLGLAVNIDTTKFRVDAKPGVVSFVEPSTSAKFSYQVKQIEADSLQSAVDQLSVMYADFDQVPVNMSFELDEYQLLKFMDSDQAYQHSIVIMPQSNSDSNYVAVIQQYIGESQNTATLAFLEFVQDVEILNSQDEASLGFGEVNDDINAQSISAFDRAVLQTKPSVKRVFGTYCVQVSLDDEYRSCVYDSATGFFVNEYSLLTYSDKVNYTDEQKLFESIYYLDNMDLIADVVKSQNVQQLGEESLEDLRLLLSADPLLRFLMTKDIVNYLTETAEIELQDPEIFVESAEGSMVVTESGQLENVADQLDTEILVISDKGLVAFKLENQQAHPNLFLDLPGVSYVNSEVYTLHYPQFDNDNVFNPEASNTYLSVNSAQVKESGEDNELKVDFSSNYLGAGAPLIASQGELIGITTDDPTYVLGATEIRSILDESEIQVGLTDINDIWRKAVFQFFNQEYDKSSNLLGVLLSDYPHLTDLSDIRQEAGNLHAAGFSKSSDVLGVSDTKLFENYRPASVSTFFAVSAIIVFAVFCSFAMFTWGFYIRGKKPLPQEVK